MGGKGGGGIYFGTENFWFYCLIKKSSKQSVKSLISNNKKPCKLTVMPKQASVKSHAPSSRAIIRHILENCGEDINDTEGILLSDISTTDSEWDMVREGQSSDESGDLWEPWKCWLEAIIPLSETICYWPHSFSIFLLVIVFYQISKYAHHI